MKTDFSFTQNDLVAVTSVAFTVFFFTTYWFIFDSRKVRDWFYARYPGDTGKIKHILFTKCMGFLLMGVLLPCAFVLVNPSWSFDDLGISISKGSNLKSLLWIAAVGLLVIVMNFFAARRTKSMNMYPQIRVKDWDPRLMLMYGAGWSIYLLGYEIMYRGVFLFPLIDTIGLWPALALNTAHYSATHIKKGVDETWASIPGGLFFAWVTIETGTIWASVGIHIFLALSNSYFAMRNNPEMRFVRTRKLKAD
jgi:membrane protease YdiL (CAAX protease family)